MIFEQVREGIISILELAAAGRYAVYGGQTQSKGAEENIIFPRVTVYYQSGSFPEASAGRTGYIIHEAIYRIEVTVYVQHYADLAILNDPGSTAAQRAAALAALDDPTLPYKADKKIDEVLGIVYQELMDARNYDFGFDKGIVSDRWIGDIQKDNPAAVGEYMAIAGTFPLSMRLCETIPEEVGVEAEDIDSTIDIDEDQGDNLGVNNILKET